MIEERTRKEKKIHTKYACSTVPYTMGVLPSMQPVATFGSSFILSFFDLACPCCVPYVVATVFGVGRDVGSDNCNDDGCTSPYHIELN